MPDENTSLFSEKQPIDSTKIKIADIVVLIVLKHEHELYPNLCFFGWVGEWVGRGGKRLQILKTAVVFVQPQLQTICDCSETLKWWDKNKMNCLADESILKWENWEINSCFYLWKSTIFANKQTWNENDIRREQKRETINWISRVFTFLQHS